MALTDAPLFDDVAAGPPGGNAYWADTEDGLRIRVAYWPAENARGTLLLMPGRTEYVEKYGSTAAALAQRGVATVSVDWRGQGLADRLLDDRRYGHIGKFSDYQRDVAAMLRVAKDVDAPGPYVVLGHSMGGAIGLRAIYEGLDVQGCIFTGPMWGIYYAPLMRPLAWVLPRAARIFNLGTMLPPTITLDSYPLANPFEDNMLTRDSEMYAMMGNQLRAHPDLQLGGPTLTWVHEANMECQWLAAKPSPDLPCITFLGDAERIIKTEAVKDRMARWPRGTLIEVPQAEHEVLMEVPQTRTMVHDKIAQMFEPQQTQSLAESA